MNLNGFIKLIIMALAIMFLISGTTQAAYTSLSWNGYGENANVYVGTQIRYQAAVSANSYDNDGAGGFYSNLEYEQSSNNWYNTNNPTIFFTDNNWQTSDYFTLNQIGRYRAVIYCFNIENCQGEVDIKHIYINVIAKPVMRNSIIVYNSSILKQDDLSPIRFDISNGDYTSNNYYRGQLKTYSGTVLKYTDFYQDASKLISNTFDAGRYIAEILQCSPSTCTSLNSTEFWVKTNPTGLLTFINSTQIINNKSTYPDYLNINATITDNYDVVYSNYFLDVINPDGSSKQIESSHVNFTQTPIPYENMHAQTWWWNFTDLLIGNYTFILYNKEEVLPGNIIITQIYNITINNSRGLIDAPNVTLPTVPNATGRRYGDVQNNTIVGDAGDVAMVHDIYLGLILSTDASAGSNCNVQAADLDNNNIINAIDYNYINNYSLGMRGASSVGTLIDTTFTCEYAPTNYLNFTYSSNTIGTKYGITWNLNDYFDLNDKAYYFDIITPSGNRISKLNDPSIGDDWYIDEFLTTSGNFSNVGTFNEQGYWTIKAFYYPIDYYIPIIGTHIIIGDHIDVYSSSLYVEYAYPDIITPQPTLTTTVGIQFNSTNYILGNRFNISVNISGDFRNYTYFVSLINPENTLVLEWMLKNETYPKNFNVFYSDKLGVWSAKIYSCKYGFCSQNKTDLFQAITTVTGIAGKLSFITVDKNVYNQGEIVKVNYSYKQLDWDRQFVKNRILLSGMWMGVNRQWDIINQSGYFEFTPLEPTFYYLNLTYSPYWGQNVVLASTKFQVSKTEISGDGYGLSVTPSESQCGEQITIIYTTPNPVLINTFINVTYPDGTLLEMIPVNSYSGYFIRSYTLYTSGMYQVLLYNGTTLRAQSLFSCTTSADGGINGEYKNNGQNNVGDSYGLGEDKSNTGMVTNLIILMGMPIFWGLVFLLIAIYYLRKNSALILPVLFILINVEAVVGLLEPYTMYIVVITWLVIAINFIFVQRKSTG